jgi:hypothetical protein
MVAGNVTDVYEVLGTASAFCGLNFCSFLGGSPRGRPLPDSGREAFTDRFAGIAAESPRWVLEDAIFGSLTGILSEGDGGRSVRCENMHVGLVHVVRSGHGRFWNKPRDENILVKESKKAIAEKVKFNPNFQCHRRWS